jgi:hypothetical protein
MPILESKENLPVAVGKVNLSELGFDQMQRVGKAFVASGMFKDLRDVSQATVKMVIGQSMGLSMYECLMGFDIIEGRIEMKPWLMAALIDRSSEYRYRIVERTNEVCSIAFDNRKDGVWVEQGVSTFSKEDAVRAGLWGKGTWQKYPANMLYARAMGNGARIYAAGALGGAYTEGEIEQVQVLNGAPPAPPVAAIEAVDVEYTETQTYTPPDDIQTALIRSLAGQLGWTDAKLDLELEMAEGDVPKLISRMNAEIEKAHPRKPEPPVPAPAVQEPVAAVPEAPAPSTPQAPLPLSKATMGKMTQLLPDMKPEDRRATIGGIIGRVFESFKLTEEDGLLFLERYPKVKDAPAQPTLTLIKSEPEAVLRAYSDKHLGTNFADPDDDFYPEDNDD